jgi:hypothetical protein
MTRTQTIARVVTATAALLAVGILAAGVRGGISFPTAAGSRADPAPCVATVLPNTYYQAIAEMTACTGRGVAVEIEPAGTYWAIRGDVPPPGQGSRVIVDP